MLIVTKEIPEEGETWQLVFYFVFFVFVFPHYTTMDLPNLQSSFFQNRVVEWFSRIFSLASYNITLFCWELGKGDFIRFFYFFLVLVQILLHLIGFPYGIWLPPYLASPLPPILLFFKFHLVK